MPTRKQRAQQNAARAAAQLTYKRRRLEASAPLNLSQHIDTISTINTDDTNGTGDTDDTDDTDKTDDMDETDETENETRKWFWNESADESDTETQNEEEDSDTDESDQEMERSRAEPMAKPTAVLKWNREGEQNRRGAYGKGSVSSLRRQRIAAEELAKEASKSYNIEALWQRSRDLGMVSSASTQEERHVSSLANVPRGSRPPCLKRRQIRKNQQIEALRDLKELLQSVKKQEKKYGDRLSPLSNYYRRHQMVQQFLQAQLKTANGKRTAISEEIAQGFDRGQPTARNITQWENSWVNSRTIPERKERDDCTSWMYDQDVSDAIRTFAKSKGDRMYSLFSACSND